MYTDKELVIRPICEKDLRVIWEWAFRDASPEWKNWDAPYFEHRSQLYEDFLAKKENWLNRESCWAIEVDGNVIGTVSYYWEHEPSRWLEMGIVIYDPEYWSGGYGTRVLRLWIEHLFNTLEIARVGFTTWSGNHRMMRAGEKIGMKLEARLRKCRYYNGTYYDSIRMGLLREEWEESIREESRALS